MSNNRLIGLVLLVAGAALFYFGYNATQSTAEAIGEAFTGKYSDETTFYLIGGGVAVVAGLVMLLKK